MEDTRLLTASFQSALLGKVKAWHAIFFQDGHVEQLVEMMEQTGESAEPMITRRAFYSELDPGMSDRLRRAFSSQLFHDLKPRYETREGLLHYRELNSAKMNHGRHRVVTHGACSLAHTGDPDMIIFMGIWEKIRRNLPVLFEEPKSHSPVARMGSFDR